MKPVHMSRREVGSHIIVEAGINGTGSDSERNAQKHEEKKERDRPEAEHAETGKNTVTPTTSPVPYFFEEYVRSKRPK